MAKNVFLVFYSILSVPGHFWSHLVTDYHIWSHLATFASILVTPGNKYQHLVTSWSNVATSWSDVATTFFVLYKRNVGNCNIFSFLVTAGHSRYGCGVTCGVTWKPKISPGIYLVTSGNILVT